MPACNLFHNVTIAFEQFRVDNLKSLYAHMDFTAVFVKRIQTRVLNKKCKWMPDNAGIASDG